MRLAFVATLVLLFALQDASPIAAAEGGGPERSELGRFIPISPAQPAPAVSFTDLAGNTADLSDFAGKFVLVNLWATWCGPCVEEMPSLERLQATLGDKITVVAISEDRGGSKAVEPFIAKHGLKSVKVYLDPKSAVGRAFQVEGLPSSFLIDRERKMVGQVSGAAEWDAPEMLKRFGTFLGEDGIVKTSLPQARP